MDEEGMQDTANKLIHIGKPIELDEDEFFIQLKKLEDASRDEVEDIRPLVQQIVPDVYKRQVVSRGKLCYTEEAPI